MSTEKIYVATLNHVVEHFSERARERESERARERESERAREREKLHLDIGSGTGELIKLFKEKIGTKASCCDYTDTLMQLPGQRVDIIDLNRNKMLPYSDNEFDIVTATEVVEHLEDFRGILREIHRVLKPGGIFVLSTPNILNLNSRLRNLWFGFAELMGPLPINDRKIESCAGHINPISLFYIMHALYEINFNGIKFSVDKYQRSGIGKAIFLLLPIKFAAMKIWWRETRKYKTIDDSNKEIVGYINSISILLGRTIIVSAVK